MSWTPAKPLIKLGYPSNLDSLNKANAIGDLYAMTDYKTGKTLFYQLSVIGKRDDLFFESFEKAMLFADLNDIVVDTRHWAAYGISRVYSFSQLGDEFTFSDGTTKILEGLDD